MKMLWSPFYGLLYTRENDLLCNHVFDYIPLEYFWKVDFKIIVNYISVFSITYTLEVSGMWTLDWVLIESNAEFTKSLGTFVLTQNHLSIFGTYTNYDIFCTILYYFPITNRLIVVAEKDVVYSKFPIPLINRLEKHFLNISTMLSPVQLNLVHKLEEWAEKFIKSSTPLFRTPRCLSVKINN